MEINKEILERNYLKLWVMERVDFPFLFATHVLREKWQLPIEGGHEKVLENCKMFFKKLNYEDKKFFASKKLANFAPAINEIANLPIPKERAKTACEEILSSALPSQKFSTDIENLIKEFSFEKMWTIPITMYIITGKIYAPHERLSANAPTPLVTEQFKIFTLVAKKNSQHDFLKKTHGFKTTKRKEEIEGENYITLLDTNTPLLPNALIHDYTNIADMIYGGTDKFDDDVKKNNRIKQQLKRFRKNLVPLTPANRTRLEKIFKN